MEQRLLGTTRPVGVVLEGQQPADVDQVVGHERVLGAVDALPDRERAAERGQGLTRTVGQKRSGANPTEEISTYSAYPVPRRISWNRGSERTESKSGSTLSRPRPGQ